MKKNLSRIVRPSEVLADYPERMLSTFDRRIKSPLSWVIINNLPVGFDRQELHPLSPQPADIAKK